MPRNCGFMPYHYHAVETEPGYAQQRRLIEASAMLSRTARLQAVVTIPVVVHVVAHADQADVTDEQIARQIETLNGDYRARNADRGDIPQVFRNLADDAGIEFRLASRDPLGRPTTGINRIETEIPIFPSVPPADPNKLTAAIDAELKTASNGAVAWPRNEYLNLWVCNMDRNPLGYAAFPGFAAWRDGVVIDFTCFGSGGSAHHPFDLGRTAVHEVAHWLDLLHIWGDDDGACSLSDNVADTPNQAGPNFNMPVFPSVSCNNAPNGDLFMNYMDYVDDAAMVMFTAKQVDRMHAALQGPRRSLLVSRGLDAPSVEADFKAIVPDAALAALAEQGSTPELVFDGVGWVSPAEIELPL